MSIDFAKARLEALDLEPRPEVQYAPQTMAVPSVARPGLWERWRRMLEARAIARAHRRLDREERSVERRYRRARRRIERRYARDLRRAEPLMRGGIGSLFWR